MNVTCSKIFVSIYLPARSHSAITDHMKTNRPKSVLKNHHLFQKLTVEGEFTCHSVKHGFSFFIFFPIMLRRQLFCNYSPWGWGRGDVVLSLSHSQLFATPWTVAHRLLCPLDFTGKNTWVGCYFLCQSMTFQLDQMMISLN